MNLRLRFSATLPRSYQAWLGSHERQSFLPALSFEPFLRTVSRAKRGAQVKKPCRTPRPTGSGLRRRASLPGQSRPARRPLSRGKLREPGRSPRGAQRGPRRSPGAAPEKRSRLVPPPGYAACQRPFRARRSSTGWKLIPVSLFLGRNW